MATTLLQELLKDIRTKIEHDAHTPAQLYAYVRQLGMQMFMTNRMSRETVVDFTGAMLKLYIELYDKTTQKQP